MTPLIFVNISENFANEDRFFSTDVNNPATRIIIPCPIENKNSINAAYMIFVLKDAAAIMPARIGVEHGVVANAKTMPRTIG